MEKKPFMLWLMGPTASGKTTLAAHLVDALREQGQTVLWYDGDEARDLFGPNLGFQAEDRLRVVKSLVHYANKAIDGGVNVIVSALTANQDARDYIHGECRNLLVGALCCSIDACMERDPKGMYEKAKNGEVTTLIGYNTEYKQPERYDVLIDTQGKDVEACVQDVLLYLDPNGA